MLQHWTGRLVMALALAVSATSDGAAQDVGRAVSLLAGASQYDLSGTGTTFVGSVRVDLPQGRRIVVEPGLAYLPYEGQGGPRIHHVLPEVQVQVQHPGARVRPYLGVGVGGSWAIWEGDDVTDATLSGAAGLRLLGGAWMARGELRVRVIDPWVGTTADWSIGVGRAF